jgi:hypothetical protein
MSERWGDTRRDREALDRHLTDQPEPDELDGFRVDKMPAGWPEVDGILNDHEQPEPSVEELAREDPDILIGRILSGPGTEEPWIIKTDLGFWYRLHAPQIYTNLSHPSAEEVCVGMLIAVNCHGAARMIGAV